MKMFFLIVLFAVLGYLLCVGIPFLLRAQAGYKLAREAKPFSREDSAGIPSILVVGDSTAFGTGAESPELSIAGYFGRDFPQASITNLSKNGAKLEDVEQVLRNLTQDKKFDLILIQAGANDVIFGSNLSSLPARIDSVLTLAQERGEHVVWLSAGNIGLAPLFPWPINRYLTLRTLTLRAHALGAAEKHDIVYVDLYKERGEDAFEKDVPTFYAADRLHLSGRGYAFWYERIREEMEKNQIVLPR